MATISKSRAEIKYDEPLWGSQLAVMVAESQVGYYATPMDFFPTRPKVEIERAYDWLMPIEIGDKTYFLPKRLFHITEAINKAKKLLDLKEGWDDDDALAISKVIYFRAMETLIEYAIKVLDVHNTAINCPYISAGRDGSIDLEWNNSNANLLLTILNTNDFNLHYYGDDGNNNTVIKGTIEETKINEDLSHWMRKL